MLCVCAVRVYLSLIQCALLAGPATWRLAAFLPVTLQWLFCPGAHSGHSASQLLCLCPQHRDIKTQTICSLTGVRESMFVGLKCVSRREYARPECNYGNKIKRGVIFVSSRGFEASGSVS